MLHTSMPANRNSIGRVKLLIYLLAAGIGVVLYSHFSNPLITAGAAGMPTLFGTLVKLPGDLPQYTNRFFLSFLLLGVVPFFVTLVFREKPALLGFRRPRSFFRPPLFFFIAGAAVLGGYAGSRSAEFASFYPYSSTMVELAAEQGLAVFFLHGALYFLFYYVPWEFFFRGFLIFPFVRELVPGFEDSKRVTPRMLAIASFQVIPSALLHFGHPVSESLGAVVFGLAAAWFALKTRSIWPALVFHGVMGISLDFFLFLKAV